MTGPSEVALLLPGQGSQHALMAAGLYDHEPVFTAAMDEVFAAMGSRGARLRDAWLAPEPPVADAAWAQPLLFAVDVALGRTVAGWGVRPRALLGHSVGEIAAAALAGVFGVADAIALVLDRVDRLAAAPPGGMVVVAASAEQVAPLLVDGVVVGARNAPLNTMLAGAAGPLRVVIDRLRAADLTFRVVPSTTAFHSPAVAAAAAGAAAAVAAVHRAAPTVPVYSGYTAAPLGPAELADPTFWAAQPAAPVRFWAALDALLGSGDLLLVEAGPGRELSMLARRHPALRSGRSRAVALLGSRTRSATADRESLAAARTLLAPPPTAPLAPSAPPVPHPTDANGACAPHGDTRAPFAPVR